MQNLSNPLVSNLKSDLLYLPALSRKRIYGLLNHFLKNIRAIQRNYLALNVFKISRVKMLKLREYYRAVRKYNNDLQKYPH